MPAVSQPKIDAIIEDLYAGTLDASAWDRAIGAMVDLLGCTGAILFAVNPTTQTILRDEVHRLDPQGVQLYRQHWITQDIRIGPGLRRPVGEPHHIQEVVPQNVWRRSAILNEFLIPSDVPFFLATWLHKSPQKIVTLAFQASSHHGSFDDADSKTVKRLVPHLRRALEIRNRLESHQIRASTLTVALEQSHFGVIVLDEGGRILESTGLADELLRVEPTMRRQSDHTLWLREPAGSRLRQWVLTGTPPENVTDGVLRIPRNHGLQSLSIVVTPMPPVPYAWLGNEPRWLLFVFDPDRHISPVAAIVSRDLEISPREAEIAVMLSMGQSLSTIASRLGITMNTARAHLKHVFAKTQLRSQSDLVRRVLASPAIHHAGRSTSTT
jgi:DNA-binding CsgD family transcriptional regulator